MTFDFTFTLIISGQVSLKHFRSGLSIVKTSRCIPHARIFNFTVITRVNTRHVRFNEKVSKVRVNTEPTVILGREKKRCKLITRIELAKCKRAMTDQRWVSRVRPRIFHTVFAASKFAFRKETGYEISFIWHTFRLRNDAVRNRPIDWSTVEQRKRKQFNALAYRSVSMSVYLLRLNQHVICLKSWIELARPVVPNSERVYFVGICELKGRPNDRWAFAQSDTS